MEDLKAISQQLESFMKMYKEDEETSDRRLLDLTTRFEEFALVHSDPKGSNHKHHGENNKTGCSSSESGDANSLVPKPPSMDFPSFHGMSDPIDWLSCCEQFFRHQHTSEDAKLGATSFHLEGDAQLWFSKLHLDRPDLTWADFKTFCLLRFGPSFQDDQLGELSKIKQIGSVDDYLRRFEQLVAHASCLSIRQEVQIFISGLQEHIAIDFQIQRPLDLTNAMGLARRVLSENLNHLCSNVCLRQEWMIAERGVYVSIATNPIIHDISARSSSGSKGSRREIVLNRLLWTLLVQKLADQHSFFHVSGQA